MVIEWNNRLWGRCTHHSRLNTPTLDHPRRLSLQHRNTPVTPFLQSPYSLTTLALLILGLVRSDSIMVSSGTESRFKTVSTSPPRWSLLKDMFAMFTACVPRTVPIWPTIPGTS